MIKKHIFSYKNKDIIINAKSEGRAREILKIKYKDKYLFAIYKGIRLNDNHKIDWNLLNN